MQIELGNAQQLSGIIKTALAVCRELNKDGTLKEIGTGISELRRAIAMDTAKLDADKYDYYTRHGISSEHAILLLCAHKAEMHASVWKVLAGSKHK